MKRLHRSKFGAIGGVCKGISDHFNVDETLIRILFIALVFTQFPIILTYLFMWALIPLEQDNNV